jgi:hypothetical protein
MGKCMCVYIHIGKAFFKKNFTILEAYINLFVGHVQCFERINAAKHTSFTSNNYGPT